MWSAYHYLLLLYYIWSDSANRFVAASEIMILKSCQSLLAAIEKQPARSSNDIRGIRRVIPV